MEASSEILEDRAGQASCAAQRAGEEGLPNVAKAEAASESAVVGCQLVVSHRQAYAHSSD